jgi:RHS repeat-associated protein
MLERELIERVIRNNISNGARYVDVRVTTTWREDIKVRNGKVETMLSTVERGLGVRSLVKNGWESGTYTYDGSGNITATGDTSYRYDRYGRLSSQSLNSTVQRSYDYDRWGNHQKDADGATLAVSAATNRLSNETYDETGNQLTSGGVSRFTYDALGSMIKEAGVKHFYTASGERIWSYDPAINTSTWSLRGPGGQVVREWANGGAYLDSGPGTGHTWNWTKDYVYRGGSLLAAVDSGGTTYLHLDHLGTPRLHTRAGATERHDYAPFGKETTSAGTERMKFTGHQRGAELASALTLDYMHARYYSPVSGRFVSVDPRLGSKSEPRTWNRYSYVAQNPMTFVDPDGREKLDAGLLQFFNTAFRHDFSNVDVYTLSKSGAGYGLALNNIFLFSGNWTERNVYGLGLLAHELTHVYEQNNQGLGSWVWKYFDSWGANWQQGMGFGEARANTDADFRADNVARNVVNFLAENPDIAQLLVNGQPLTQSQLALVVQLANSLFDYPVTGSVSYVMIDGQLRTIVKLVPVK